MRAILSLKVQPCELKNEVDVITLTQIINVKSLAFTLFVALLLFSSVL